MSITENIQQFPREYAPWVESLSDLHVEELMLLHEIMQLIMLKQPPRRPKHSFEGFTRSEVIYSGQLLLSSF